jgi:hypothetical protein
LAAGIEYVKALKLGARMLHAMCAKATSALIKVPNPKLQRNSNHQTPKRVVGEYWRLGFLWDLVLGLWDLQEL